MNKTTVALLSFLCVFLLSCSSGKEDVKDLTQLSLIPKPASITPSTGVFQITRNTSIIVQGDSDEGLKIAEYLAQRLRPSTGYEIKTSSTKEKPQAGNIYLSLSDDSTLGSEGYELTITDDNLLLKANKPAGLFWGVQTIRQLLPASIELTAVQNGPWKIAAGTIRDIPEYSFRGSMLDVARHFFSVDDVKRYIDLIAFYKMNVMHLHLTDDQGWRIEIKSWPNLTTYGGSTEVGGGKGGFYTQEEYKDIVHYAQERYITIIPEVDLPGHTNAALASYPELNVGPAIKREGKRENPADSATALNARPVAGKLYTGVAVGFSTLNAKKDVTFKFIDDVVRELAEITPGPYIHLGGDESHATKKEDYLFIVNKVQEIVEAHGKHMIGWEEIAQTNLKPQTVVQYWSNVEHAKEAVRKDAMIIMSPAKVTYLDMKYDSTTKLGQDWAARIEIDSAYRWNLSTRVHEIPKEKILGIEAPLWTETITNMDEIEYMVFPRLPGYAELGWSKEEGRTWEDYKTRLGAHADRFKAMDIDFYRSKQISWQDEAKQDEAK
jgi:hexosaminidase